MSLIQAGWRADAVSWLCIQAINGIYNRSGAGGRASPADPDFYLFMELFRKVQTSRSVGIRMEETQEKKKSIVFFFRKKDLSPEAAADSNRLRELLGIDPGAQELSVVYGALPQNNREIAILTRSMLEILVELASYIDVPQVHVAEQRTLASDVDGVKKVGGLVTEVRIHSGLERPTDAFVMVPYRGKLLRQEELQTVMIISLEALSQEQP